MTLKNYTVFKWASAMLIIIIFGARLKAQDVVDATTWSNKVMAGYQGWFRTPGDRPGSTSWAHVFNGRGTGTELTPQRLAFDTWPDMSQYDSDEKTEIPGFKNPDGTPATMYSAQNLKTVMRHFQWMKQYGIDGVWLSEFCRSFINGKPDSAMYKVMQNVRIAAKATGRAYAFMWDMSSFNGNTPKDDVYNTLVNYWKKMVDDGVTSDDRYMHQDGKPVLLIWGFFPERPASQPEYMNRVIDFLLTPGKYQATLVGGVTDTWRQGTPEFVSMLMRMQGLQPWSVGRRFTDANTGYVTEYMDEWGEDMKLCAAHNVTFMPVINSGFNRAGPPPTPPTLPLVPRRMGNYLWPQFIKASQTGTINSAFIAMFDEINEGTEITKVTNKPPVNAHFITYEGATNDYYLRLIGTASRMLKNHEPFTDVIPISPFDEKKTYIITNRSSNLKLHSAGKTAGSFATAVAKGGEWQILFDGKGYFIIKNRISGKVLSSGMGNTVSAAADTKSDATKWHLEWDATASCRMINKLTGKTIIGGAKSTIIHQVDAPVKPDELKDRDDLRWQVIEQ